MRFLFSVFISLIFSDMTVTKPLSVLFLISPYTGHVRLFCHFFLRISVDFCTLVFYRVFLQKGYCSLNKLGRDFMDTLYYTFKEFFMLIC